MNTQTLRLMDTFNEWQDQLERKWASYPDCPDCRNARLHMEVLDGPDKTTYFAMVCSRCGYEAKSN